MSFHFQSKGGEQLDLMNRANVYANDEFDVFSNAQVDHSKIHKGKKMQKLKNDVEDKETVEKVNFIILDCCESVLCIHLF